MRDLERQFRITARSIPDVIGSMERTVSRYGESRRVTFRGRKLSNEAFVNAALIYLLDLEPARQEAALKDGLNRLETMLGEDFAPATDNGRQPSVGKPIDPKPRRTKSTG